MPRNDDVTGIVLAGGAGRRMRTGIRKMGAPKPLLRLGDMTLVEHVVAAIEPLVSGVIVVTNDAEAMAFLGLPTVGDAEPGRGPLMGLYSGLLACPTPFALAVACDAPFLSPALLEALIASPPTRRHDAARDGARPAAHAGRLPHRPRAEHRVAAGRRPRSHARPSGDRPSGVAVGGGRARAGPGGRSFKDLDTPEDLAAAQAMLEGRA